MCIRALVVDDSSTMRQIIIHTLNLCGVTDTVEAANGVEAMEIVHQVYVELILLDWNMPEKNGLEVLREIRAEGNDVPIMMVTTEAERSRVVATLEIGVSDYLIKPFHATALQEKLHKLVVTSSRTIFPGVRAS